MGRYNRFSTDVITCTFIKTREALNLASGNNKVDMTEDGLTNAFQ